MELKIICKRLITGDLNGSITEGENGADVVGITVPRYYGEHDLSLFSFRMTAVSGDGKNAAEQLLTQDLCGDDAIHLLWTVTSDFTALDGELTLILAGVGSDGEVIKFSSEPVNIGNDGRVEFLPTPSLSEQLFGQVQLEAQKALSAAERAEKAAESYTLKAASEDEIGGVLSGGDISVSESGSVTVNSVGGNTVGTSVPENAVFTDTVYTLPKASKTALGGVKVDGRTVVINGDGVISAAEKYTLPAASGSALGGIKSGGDISVSKSGSVTVNSVGGKTLGTSVPAGAKFTDTVYKLPTATANSLGGVMVDGTTITTNGKGVISVIGGHTETGEIILPKATENALGAVRVDGKTIMANADGVISTAAGAEIPPAESEKIGGVLSGGDISVSETGNVTVNSVCGNTVGTSVPENAVFTDTVYELPVAAENALGGIVSGGDISVSETGNVTVNSVCGNSVEASVPADAVFTDTVYELPAATGNELGGVVSGGDISVSKTGNVTVNSVCGNSVGTSVPENAVFTDTVYELPAAAENALGGVVSGGDISVSETGNVTVNSVGGNTIGTSVPENAVFTDTVYELPPATETSLGGVKVDGLTITASEDGVISSTASGVPKAKLLVSIPSKGTTENRLVTPNAPFANYKFIIMSFALNSVDKSGLVILRREELNVGGALEFPCKCDKTVGQTYYNISFKVDGTIMISTNVCRCMIWGSNDLFEDI